jgi:hypothetical protein
MICIDKELIEKELRTDIENGYSFMHKALSNKLLDNLFNKYYVVEACENFYDSEPNFDEELFSMYMDYEEIDKNEDFKYSKQPHTRAELKEAYEKVNKMYEEYEPKRIQFCNWQEPYFKGNWGVSQKRVNIISRNMLKEFRKLPVSKNERIYFAKKDNEVRIYLYGRDIIDKDLWFLFKRK